MPIEDTFDRTVLVFKEAGYKLDVIDRATGQISGRRGATGDKGSVKDKDLKFYALGHIPINRIPNLADFWFSFLTWEAGDGAV